MKLFFQAVFLLLINIQFSTQFTLDKYWSIDLGISITKIKQLFPDEKWEQKESDDGVLHSFYSWISPNSIKVSFLISDGDQLRMKSISNAKVDEESAQKLFESLKEILSKKYGNKYEKKEISGKVLLLWRTGKEETIALSNDGPRTIMINVVMVAPPVK